MTSYFGIDLAWGEGTATKPANETGVALLRDDGTIAEAGWTVGVPDTAAWIIQRMSPGDVIAIDAPLVVNNPAGMRECERQVGQRYGRWKVAANASNLALKWLGGVTLRALLEDAGVVCDDGVRDIAAGTTTMFECYPYTTLVGAAELGYEIERPRYKRPNLRIPPGDRRAARAVACDDLIRRLVGLESVSPALDLLSHPTTADLATFASPFLDRPYKHREDLIDAVLSAWTAALWHQHGLDRCQVLGAGCAPDEQGRRPTIIAPARPEQRR